MCIEILIDNNIQNSLAFTVVYCAYDSYENGIDYICLLRPIFRNNLFMKLTKAGTAGPRQFFFGTLQQKSVTRRVLGITNIAGKLNVARFY